LQRTAKYCHAHSPNPFAIAPLSTTHQRAAAKEILSHVHLACHSTPLRKSNSSNRHRLQFVPANESNKEQASEPAIIPKALKVKSKTGARTSLLHTESFSFALPWL
jgi:hypothetical protein